MDGTERVQPDSRYYLIALSILAFGIGLTAYSLVSGFRRIRENMVRMDVPGQMDLELKQSETYTVFIERDRFTARYPRGVPATRVSCEVHALPSGEKIETTAPNLFHKYNYGNRMGRSFLEFQAPHDGMYMLACRTFADVTGENMEAAVGGGSSRAINIVIGRSFLTFMMGVVAAGLISMRVTKLRLESRNEIRLRGLKPV